MANDESAKEGDPAETFMGAPSPMILLSTVRFPDILEGSSIILDIASGIRI